MNIIVTRDVFTDTFTLGRIDILYGALAYSKKGWAATAQPVLLPFGFTAEDRDRGLASTLPLSTNKTLKVKKETCIPTSPAEGYLATVEWSESRGCDVLRLAAVPAFQGILWHPGNDQADTEGCQLPGLSRSVSRGTVSDSRAACAWLTARVRECVARSEPVRVIVKRDEAAWGAFIGVTRAS